MLVKLASKLGCQALESPVRPRENFASLVSHYMGLNSSVMVPANHRILDRLTNCTALVKPAPTSSCPLVFDSW